MTSEIKRSPALSSDTYDFFKRVAQYYLPALGTLYAAVATIWGLPFAVQAVGTITAVDIFLGVILGLSAISYNKSDAKYDGALFVGQGVEINAPLDEKTVVTLKVLNPVD